MSADFSPYINLRIFDKDAGELYLGALDLLQLNVPQLVVRPGTIEDALTQAFAYISSVAINHINVLPNRLMEGMASFMGVPRRNGSYANVTVTFTALDYDGGTIEAGTTLEYSYQIGTQTYRDYYEVIDSVTIYSVTPDPEAIPPTPLPSAQAKVFAIEQGQKQPVPSGAELAVINVQPTADSAIASTDFVQGEPEESDEEYLARASTYMRSLSTTLATAKQVESYVVSSFDYIDRVKAYDLTDSETNREEGGPDAPGYISLFIYGKDKFASIQERNEILEVVSSKMLAGLQLVVEDMDLLNVTINVAVKVVPGADIYSVDSTVRRQLLNYFSPSKFPYSEPAIRKSAIIAEINKIPNISHVETLTFSCDNTTADGDDLLLNDKGCLPRLSPADLTLVVGFV